MSTDVFDPTDQADPTDPTGFADPTDPTGFADQADPTDPTEFIVLVHPEELVARPPFSDLFPINPETQDAITESMRVKGFHISKPIDIWRTEHENVIVDGRTRKLSAVTAGIKWVPICFHDFANEDEAVDYAIANQRDRRNMTDADILRCIELRDKRRPRGGDRRSEEARSNGSREPFGQTSEEETAAATGTSPAKVKRSRAVIASDPDLKKAVLDGDMSINKAAKVARERRRKKKESTPVVGGVEQTPVEPIGADSDEESDLIVGDTEPPSDLPDQPLPISAKIDDLDDGERGWLESLPLRDKLSNRDRFDLDALIYMHFWEEFQTLRDKMRERIGMTAPEFAGPVYAAVDRLGSLPPPEEWVLCETCQGAGQVGQEDCHECLGGGYRIPGF